MKRDFDLVRKLLIEFEERDYEGLQSIAPEGYSNEEIRYNIELLRQAEFLTFETFDHGGHRCKQLSWQGHELLDSIRESGQWSKIKSFLKEKSLSLSFESIKAAATAIIKNSIIG